MGGISSSLVKLIDILAGLASRQPPFHFFYYKGTTFFPNHQILGSNYADKFGAMPWVCMPTIPSRGGNRKTLPEEGSS